MKTIEIFLEGIRDIIKSKGKMIAIVLICIVPVLYTFFYLKAFWDPYKNMSNLPVAIVNQDKGSENSHYGDELMEKLKGSTELKWNFVDRAVADSGLEDKTYYAVFVVPENFSTSIESAKNGNPQSAQIELYINSKNSFMASLLSKQVEERIKTSLSSGITRSYTKATFDSLISIKDGMDKTAEGSGELASGFKTLTEKTKTLQAGVGELSQGANSLYDGVVSVNNGLGELAGSGLKLQSGLNSVKEIQSGAKKVADSTQTLAGAVGTLTEKARALNGSFTKINNSTMQIKNGVISASSSLEKLAVNNPELMQNKDFLTALATLREIQAPLDTYSTGISEYADGIYQYTMGMNTLNSGVGELHQGAEKVQQSLGAFQADFGKGLDTYVTSVATLQSGSTKLKEGASGLKDGLKSINEKMPELQAGNEKILEGLESLSSGTKEGADKLKDSLPDSSEAMAAFISAPIQAEQADLNEVPNYGTSFAPYFSSLSLWLGALMLTMAIGLRVVKKEKWDKSGSLQAIIGRYSLFAIVGLFQTSLMLVIFKLLGISPTSWGMLFVVLLVVSLMCIAFITMLISIFGKLGQLLVMICMIFQLTATGGTFPIELSASGFFTALHPFMPFTYSINALREVISGNPINYAVVGQSLLVLGGFIVVSLVLNILGRTFGEKVNARLAQIDT